MENELFPGRDSYVGPTIGWFGLLHHDKLYEESHDVMERVAYVKRDKPKNEIAIRLHNMIYLGDCAAVLSLKPLDDAYTASRKPLDDAYYASLKPLADAYTASRKPLADAYTASRKPLSDAYTASRKPLDDAYYASLKPLDDAYTASRKPLDDAYNASRKPLDDAILAYIRAQIPDCAWNEKKQELVFA